MKAASFKLISYHSAAGGKRPSGAGISCAAVSWKHNGFHAYQTHLMFAGDDQTNEPAPVAMTQEQACKLVHHLEAVTNDGYTLVTVNGLTDFRTLAEESGLHDECVELARAHCDLQFLIAYDHGWLADLRILAAHLDQDMLTEVCLRDGTAVPIDDEIAPDLWRRDEHKAVLDYLRLDAVATLNVARTALQKGRLVWVSSSNVRGSILLPSSLDGTPWRLPTVAEYMHLPHQEMTLPTIPIDRGAWVSWMGAQP